MVVSSCLPRRRALRCAWHYTTTSPFANQMPGVTTNPRSWAVAGAGDGDGDEGIEMMD